MSCARSMKLHVANYTMPNYIYTVYGNICTIWSFVQFYNLLIKGKINRFAQTEEEKKKKKRRKFRNIVFLHEDKI